MPLAGREPPPQRASGGHGRWPVQSHRVASRPVSDPLRRLAGECLGTFLLVGIGTGTVASSVLLGWPGGLGGVAALWGVAAAVAISLTARLSGAHLNPAVSLALALWRPAAFPRDRLLPYCAAQSCGALLAGVAVLAAFGPSLRSFETREGLVRGEPGSERAAMVFCDYFPNPALAEAVGGPQGAVSVPGALLREAAGTMLLVVLVFAMSGSRSAAVRRAAPWLVGAGLTVLIGSIAPATQAGLNPARDLGPRLVALAAGYGAVAFPGPGGGFWVYLVGPLAGGMVGGFLGSRIAPAPVRD